MRSEKEARFAPGLGLFLLFHFVLLLWPYGLLLLGQADLYYRDVAFNYWPQLEFFRQALESGQWPFWNPYLQSGTPFMAALEPPVFYPFSWLFALPFAFSICLALNLVLHHLLGALGFWVLGRALNWRFETLLFASLAWSLGGINFAMNNVHPLMNTVAWIPLLLGLCVLLTQKVKPSTVACLALCYGCQILSGHLEVVFISSLMLLSFLLMHYCLAPRRHWRASLSVLGALLLGLGLSLIQLLPSLAYVPHTSRASGVGLHQALAWSFHPWRSLQFILPHLSSEYLDIFGLNLIWGDPRLDYAPLYLSIYLGLPVLFLAFMALVKFRQHAPSFFVFSLCAVVLCALLSFGEHTPVFAFFYRYVPGFSFFRYPEKYLVFVAFFTILLSALGAECLWQDKEAGHWKSWALGGGLFLALALLLVLFFNLEAVQSFVLKQRGDLMPEQQLPLALNIWQYLQPQLHLFLLSTVFFAGLLFLYFKRSESYFLGVLLLLLVLDLLHNGRHLIWLETEGAFRTPPALVQTLKQHLKASPQWRVSNDYTALSKIPGAFQPQYRKQQILRENLYRYAVLGGDLGGRFQYPQLFSYWPAKSRSMAEVEGKYNTALFAHKLGYRATIEALLSARYVVKALTPEVEQDFQQHPAYKLIELNRALNYGLWENQWAFPRARFQTQAMLIPATETMLEIMAYPEKYGYDPRQHLLLRKDETWQQEQQRVPSRQIQDKQWTEPQFLESHNQYIKLTMSCNSSGYLVLADQYLAGWRAFDNGQEIPILQANYLMRAVRLGPGQHVIEFRYRPPGLIWGLCGSLLALVCLFGLVFGSAFSKRHQQTDLA